MVQLHRAFYDAQTEKAPYLRLPSKGALFHVLNVATDQG